MNNIDDLALQIQQGREELLCDLWECVQGLVAWHARRYYRLVSMKGTTISGVAREDLVQCGYFALLSAIRNYDSEKGSFKALLSYHLWHEFQKAIGVDGNRKHDLLNSSLSLDIPARDDDPDGEKWLDGIPDPCDCFAETEDSIYREQLHKALEAALSVIPTAEAECLRAEYFEGRTQAEIAARMNVSQERARQLRNGGLRHIRNSSAKANLERFLDSETPFFKKVGVNTFNSTRTSAVEAVMLYRERRRSELAKGVY